MEHTRPKPSLALVKDSFIGHGDDVCIHRGVLKDDEAE
jgi:hypothetical protein